MNCDNANCPEDDGCGWEFDNAGTWSSEGVIEVECGQAPPSPPGCARETAPTDADRKQRATNQPTTRPQEDVSES